MKELIRSRSLTLQKPDQAGLQYISFDTKVARYTLWSTGVGIPCVRNTRNAYNDFEQAAMVAVTWLSAESRSLMTTPSTVSLLTRSMSCIVDGGWSCVSAPRTPGAVMTISSDLD